MGTCYCEYEKNKNILQNFKNKSEKHKDTNKKDKNKIKKKLDNYKNKTDETSKTIENKSNHVENPLIEKGERNESPNNGDLYRIKTMDIINKNDYFIHDNNNNNKNNNNNTYIEPKKYQNTMVFKGEDKIVSLIQLKSGNIAAGSYDSKVRILNIITGQCILSFLELGKVICLLEFEPNKLLIGTSENNIDLWDLNQVKYITNNNSENIPKSIYNFLGHDLWVNCLVKYNDKWFASASNDAKIIMWDYYKRKNIFKLRSDDSILFLIKLNDGKLCSGGADNTIKIWDVYSRTCIKTLIGHNKWVKCLCQLSDGTLLSGGDDRTIKAWTNNDFECSCTLNGHDHSVKTLCQIDENYFASGSFDKTIKIWDIKTMKYVYELKGHSSNVVCIIKLKDNRLCSCSTDRTIRIWKKII